MNSFAIIEQQGSSLNLSLEKKSETSLVSICSTTPLRSTLTKRNACALRVDNVERMRM